MARKAVKKWIYADLTKEAHRLLDSYCKYAEKRAQEGEIDILHYMEGSAYGTYLMWESLTMGSIEARDKETLHAKVVELNRLRKVAFDIAFAKKFSKENTV